MDEEMMTEHGTLRLWLMTCFGEDEIPIDIPEPPELNGWKAVAYRRPKMGEWVVTMREFDAATRLPVPREYSGIGVYCDPYWIVEKKPVTRRKIEFTECDEPRGYRADDGRLVYPYMISGGFTCVADSPLVASGNFKCWLSRKESLVGEYK